jgi:hypothetical protein
MSLNAELALASRVLNSLNEQLPAGQKLDLEEEWNELVLSVNATRSEGASLMAVHEWRRDLEARVGGRLLHAPIERN